MQTNRVKAPLVHLSRRDVLPMWSKALIRLAAFILGMAVCGLVALLLIEKLRLDPSRLGEFYYSFIKGSFSTLARRWKFFKNVAVLLCIALALTPAFRMRFWNTGAEGQTLIGVLAAVAVNFYLGGKYTNGRVVWPDWALLVLMFIAALIAGAVWGVIPALFKAKWNTNETLFTLMLNYVATFFVSYCLIKWVPSGSSSLGKLNSGKLPTVFTGLGKSQYSDYLLIIILVGAVTALVYVYLNYSKHGYEISVVGESERTARYVGINVNKVIVRTMLMSGMLCGLAGWIIGAGLDRSVTTESVGGQGFTGIMVCWLAKFDPIMMIITSGLIIFLNLGADQISTTFDVSGAFPNVIIGIVLFFIIGSEFFINYKINFRKKEAPALAK